MFAGLKRHWEVAREAYRREKDNAKQRLPIHQKDFLPAALSVMEKPASPAGRTVIWTIMVLFTIAVLWAFIGKIDVVAVATGKVVSEGQTKVIQSFEAGVVSSINVENGSHVKQGDILIDLDPTISTADVTRLQRQRQSALVSEARNTWLLERVNSDDPNLPGVAASFVIPAAVDSGIGRVQRLLATSQLSEFRAVQAAYSQQLEEKQSELSVVGKQLDKLTETLPLLEEQVTGMAKLSSDGVTARFQYLEYEERLIGRQKDLIIEQERILQVQASIRAIEKQQEQHQQEFRKQVVSELAEATESLVEIEQELIKALQSSGYQHLRAPVDGVVQQLAVHTIGGVVKPGDPLMAIVPAKRKLQVEAKILNKDVGFVTSGQPVEVKLEAFPFTKYGMIDGVVESIDFDSIEDENLGLVYPARIGIKAFSMLVNGKDIPLTPGMSLTAEVKIGQRRLIEFLLAPLLRYKDESLRER